MMVSIIMSRLIDSLPSLQDLKSKRSLTTHNKPITEGMDEGSGGNSVGQISEHPSSDAFGFFFDSIPSDSHG